MPTPAPRVRYTTGRDVSLTTGTHQGQFVGNNGPDGPYGVFGRWSLTEGTDMIKGSFGADLVRAPLIAIATSRSCRRNDSKGLMSNGGPC